MLRRIIQSDLRVQLMQKSILLLLTFLLTTAQCLAAHQYLEKEYQNKWCKANNGTTEYILNDKTRVDCLTEDYAIEFDFANKWAESVGQSLYYALCTNKKAGIVLIMENPSKDQKYLSRLQEVAKKYDIKIWTIEPQDMLQIKPCSDIK